MYIVEVQGKIYTLVKYTLPKFISVFEPSRYDDGHGSADLVI